ncbi:ribosome assembly cofactor RimP [bacterium]|nr:ribosome assembly cofactor RimP [bacterium]
MEIQRIRAAVEAAAEQHGAFVVGLKALPGDRFTVYVDSMEAVTVEMLTKINREVTGQFDRDLEDFGLELSSPGMGSPFTEFRQYLKHRGRAVEVRTTDGRTLRGLLSEVDDQGIELRWTERQPKPVGKGKIDVERIERLGFDAIKETKRTYAF